MPEDDPYYAEGNEETFAWDEVRVADDDRTAVFTGIHSPPWWSSETSWWSFARADVEESQGAVSVLLWMLQRRAGDDGAQRVTDTERRVDVKLPNALAGRVLIDGTATLVEPTGVKGPHSEPQPWDRVRVADQNTLVVYWEGWNRPHDCVEVERRGDDLAVTVWQRAGGRTGGRYWAAVVSLTQPVAPGKIIDGAPKRR